MSDHPRRVLHVISGLQRGGIENWLISLLPLVDRRILQMDFMVNKRGCACEKQVEEAGSRIVYCPLEPHKSLSRRLETAFREGNYDVVHSHMWFFSGPILRAAFRAGVPIRIAHSHSTASPQKRNWRRRLYEWSMRRMMLHYATHCIGCSTEAMVALFGFRAKNNRKSSVLYCSINLSAFRANDSGATARQSLGIPEDVPVIGNVGNLNVMKNHDFFLDVAVELLKIRPNAYFFIAGEGVLRKALEEKARRLGIAQHVIFGGQRGDVPDLLKGVFDVFLFPSLFEGLGLAIVEATAAGLRTVYSDSVPSEVSDFFPEAFTRLSLQQPPRDWAQAVDEALKKGRIPADKAFDAVQGSHFAPAFSLARLEELYGCPSKHRST